MKRLIRLSVLLTIFVTSSANAFGIGFLVGGLASLGASIIAGRSVNNAVGGAHGVVEHAINGAHGVFEHGRQVINQSLDKANDMAKERIKEIDSLEEKFVKAIKEIEQKTSDDTDEKIKQIKELEQKTSDDIDVKIERINSVIENAIIEASKIEKNFFADLEKAIKEAECAADKILTEYFASALGRTGRLIGTHEIRVFPPILYPGEESKKYCVADFCLQHSEVYKDFYIKVPFFSTTYDDIKKYLLDRLEHIRPDTPVDSLVMTYSVISELAKRTTCFHPGVERFVEDYVSFRDKFVQLQEFMHRIDREE